MRFIFFFSYQNGWICVIYIFEFKPNIIFIIYRDIYKLFLALENDKVAAQVANIDLQKKAAKLLHREKVSIHSSIFFFFTYLCICIFIEWFFIFLLMYLSMYLFIHLFNCIFTFHILRVHVRSVLCVCNYFQFDFWCALFSYY